ncbi:MAG: HemK family protein methyltransferase [Minisyncoccia bacterium]
MRFLNTTIDLSEKVFIPETETKFWTKKAILLMKSKKFKNKKVLDILDIFSGSGFIGIAILVNVKNTKVTFSDVDENSIKQIKINLKLNKISPQRYKILKSDIFSSFPKNKKYDFILANPPYVALKYAWQVQKSVLKKDPFISLFSGKDGLNHIRVFLSRVKKFLKNGGFCFMEFDPRQKKEIRKILQKEKLKYIIKKDQYDLNRYVIIKN